MNFMKIHVQNFSIDELQLSARLMDHLKFHCDPYATVGNRCHETDAVRAMFKNSLAKIMQMTDDIVDSIGQMKRKTVTKK